MGIAYLEQAGNDGVQSVCRHLGVHELEQRLTRGQDPTVENVGVGFLGSRVELEVEVGNLLQKSNLLVKKLVAVPQRKQHLGHDVLDTCLLEAESLSTNDWRVDEVQ